MAQMRPLLETPVLVGVGAAFDFHAGLVPQAPPWMQQAGLEWAYRLAREPRRLWRRYLRYNPRFVGAFALQLTERLRAGPSDNRPRARHAYRRQREDRSATGDVVVCVRSDGASDGPAGRLPGERRGAHPRRRGGDRRL